MQALPASYDIEIVRGDTLHLPLRFLQTPGGLPTNITGWVFTLQVRPDPYGAALKTYSNATGGSGLAIADAANGLILVSDTATATSGYNWGTAQYDLQATWPDGRVVTLLAGRFDVVADVARVNG